MKLREITTGAVLTALAIIIPVQFVFLKIVIPPFSATLASHVPMFISMLISPPVAAMVGVGSVIGFLFSGVPLYIVARAASHIIVGLVGAIMIKRGKSMVTVFALTIPIHAVIEALAVIPFGWTASAILITVGLGTAIHHAIDAVIAVSLIYALNPVFKFGYIKHSKQGA